MSLSKHIVEHPILGIKNGVPLPSKLLTKTSSMVTPVALDITPTKFFDPTATSGSNAGTFANPYFTYSALSTYLNALTATTGPGVIVGFKRGTTARPTVAGTMVSTAGCGAKGKPLILCAYGDGAAAPILDGKAIFTDWVSEGNGIYSRVFTFESEIYQSERRLYKMYGNAVPGNGVGDINTATPTHTTKAQVLTALAAAGPGICYCILQNAGVTGAVIYTHFIYPYAGENPNLGQVTGAITGIMFNFNLAENTNKGNIIVDGIHIRGTRGNSVKIFMPTGAGVGTIVQGSNIFATNNIFGQAGASALYGSGGGNSFPLFCGFTLDGGNNLSRCDNVEVSGNYIYSILHNATEFSACKNARIRYNQTDDVIRASCELYGSNNSIEVSYNRANQFFGATNPFINSTTVSGVWNNSWSYSADASTLEVGVNGESTYDLTIAFNEFRAIGGMPISYCGGLRLINNVIQSSNANENGLNTAQNFTNNTTIKSMEMYGNIITSQNPGSSAALVIGSFSAPGGNVDYAGDYNCVWDYARSNWSSFISCKPGVTQFTRSDSVAQWNTVQATTGANDFSRGYVWADSHSFGVDPQLVYGAKHKAPLSAPGYDIKSKGFHFDLRGEPIVTGFLGPYQSY